MDMEGRAKAAVMRGSFGVAESTRQQARDIRDSTEGKAALTALEGIRQQITERDKIKTLEVENAYKRQEAAIRRARLSAATAVAALDADINQARQALDDKRRLSSAMAAGGVTGAQANSDAALADLERSHTAALAKLRAQRDETAELVKLDGDVASVRSVPSSHKLTQKLNFTKSRRNPQLEERAVEQAQEANKRRSSQTPRLKAWP